MPPLCFGRLSRLLACRPEIERLDRIGPRNTLDPAAIKGNTRDRKSTRLNSSHLGISYAVFCLKKKKLVKYRRQESLPKTITITAEHAGRRTEAQREIETIRRETRHTRATCNQIAERAQEQAVR